MHNSGTAGTTAKEQVTVVNKVLDKLEKMSYFYVAACVTGIFLILLICVLVLLIKSRKKARRRNELFMYDIHDDISACKSAPISRRGSPAREKRNSCPNAYGATIEDETFVAAPSTTDGIPQFESERVQPMSSEDRREGYAPVHTGYRADSRAQIPFIRVATEVMQCSSSPPLEPSKHGRIWFKVAHDEENNQLVVTLNKVKELLGRTDEERSRDPFVRVFLLPDEHVYHTSRIHKKTLNPVFNEVFTFDVLSKDLSTRKLRLSVYDVDRRRVRHSLGHVVVPLDCLDLNSPEMMWKDLEATIQTSPSVGELNLALTYLPHIERMKVVLLKARHIRPPSDPDKGFYIRLQCHYGSKLLKTKQSHIQGPGVEINFNESFSFSTSNKNIENFNFIVSLMQTIRGCPSDDVELGHVALGSFMYARGEGLLHWQEMLAKTKSIVTKWHQLSMPTV